jgi:hypothetical protein
VRLTTKLHDIAAWAHVTECLLAEIIRKLNKELDAGTIEGAACYATLAEDIKMWTKQANAALDREEGTK